MSEEEIFDITIIGGGPSGLFGTFYAGLRQMKTKLIDALEDLGGQVAVLYPEKYIYDVPGFPKTTGKELVKNMVEQAKRFNPTLVLGDRVIKLAKNDGGIFQIETSSGRKHLSKTVLITAGVGAFSPNRLDVPGGTEYEGKGVYYFLKDKGMMKEKNILIVGGGDSACDWALNLNKWAKKVTLIHRRDVFRAHEETVNELMHSEVEVRLFYELKQVIGDGQKVTGAIVADSKTGATTKLDVDAILVNIGFRADLGPIKSWGLRIEGRDIVATGRMETNIPGVFVAGDIAMPENSVKLNLIAIAFAQAALAVNVAKTYTDPTARVFPGHSSEMKV